VTTALKDLEVLGNLTGIGIRKIFGKCWKKKFWWKSVHC